MWTELPFYGVGQRWDDDADRCRLPYLGQGIDFLEPALPTALDRLPSGVPLFAHSSELALATSGPLNPHMLATLAAQVRAVGSPWAGEHFCFNSSIETGELGYNFAPILDDTTLASTASHVRELEAAYGCTIALEAGPRYFGWGEAWDDHAMIADVAEETGCAIIIDLSHHLCSMLNLGRAPTDGLSPRVLGRTIELHVTGLGHHRTPGYYYDSHRTPVPEEVWALLTWTVARCPNLKALTLEHAAQVDDAAYAEDLRRLNQVANDHKRQQ